MKGKPDDETKEEPAEEKAADDMMDMWAPSAKRHWLNFKPKFLKEGIRTLTEFIIKLKFDGAKTIKVIHYFK